MVEVGKRVSGIVCFFHTIFTSLMEEGEMGTRVRFLW